MQKLNAWWQKPLTLSILFSAVMAVLAPLFFKLVHISTANRVGFLFVIINTVFAWWLGRYVKKNRLFWAVILVFPILFAGMIFWRYAKYDYWFAGLYLITSLMALAKD
jgi:hypothetical protein